MNSEVGKFFTLSARTRNQLFCSIIFSLGAIVCLFVMLNTNFDLKSRLTMTSNRVETTTKIDQLVLAITKKQEANEELFKSLKHEIFNVKFKEMEANLFQNLKVSIQKELELKLFALIKEASQGGETVANKEAIENLRDRHEFPVMLNKFGFKTMIEIGVQEGIYAESILSKWPTFEHYWGVDPWAQQKNYKDIANKDEKQQFAMYNSTYTLLTGKFGVSRITLIRNYSTDALGYFKKDSIDFIYLDARHDYCGVTEDLDNYYPILKCGGLFAGHDFLFDGGAGQDWGMCANGTRIEGSVKKAVLDFASRNAVKRVLVTSEGGWPSWYFMKKC